jgi:hypothetical protein
MDDFHPREEMELEVVAGGVPSKKERDDCGEGGSGDD